MADVKAEEPKNADTKTTKSESNEAKQATSKNISSKSQRYMLLGFGGLALAVLMLSSFAFGRLVSDRDDDGMHAVRFSVSGDAERMPSMQAERRGGMMQSRYDADAVSTTRVSGVVMKVSGSTITVAGNGTTTEVEVSDNTTYRGDDAPAKVNDTIFAIGATNSDGVLVASAIQLSRE